MASARESFSAVYITVNSRETAEHLAKGLVSNQLAACVNIIPGVTSFYMWDNVLEQDTEVLLMVKTTASAVPELTEWVKEHHPYDCPEVISVPITGGNPSYLQFIVDHVRPTTP